MRYLPAMLFLLLPVSILGFAVRITAPKFTMVQSSPDHVNWSYYRADTNFLIEAQGTRYFRSVGTTNNLHISNVMVHIAWDASEGADGYTVYWGTNSDMLTSYADVDTNLDAWVPEFAGTNYFVVAAYIATFEGDDSEMIENLVQ